MIENLENRNGEPPVVVRGLHKSFGAQVVLNGIALTVARGETLAVLGRSGWRDLHAGPIGSPDRRRSLQ